MSFDTTLVLRQPSFLVATPLPQATSFLLPPVTRALDLRYGGTFRVAGTVKEKNSPVNTPLRRRVWLLDQSNYDPVASVWSDAVTGDYLFDHIRGDLRYMIVSFDHTGLYRAVIADNITAEPRP